MSGPREAFGLGGDAEVAVALEPRDGHDAAEVVARLAEVGASRVQVLTPRHVSARVRRAELASLREVATVHVKARAGWRGHRPRRKPAAGAE